MPSENEYDHGNQYVSPTSIYREGLSIGFLVCYSMAEKMTCNPKWPIWWIFWMGLAILGWDAPTQ